MTKDVTRRISKNRSKTIIPPPPKEILDANFNYSDYIERILNQKIDNKIIQDFLYNQPEEIIPVDPKITKVFEEFEEEIKKIQHLYEEDLQNGRVTLDYNQEMKKIAQDYFDKLKAIEILKLQRENQFKALTAKRQELINVLQQMIELRSKIENNSEQRLQDFMDKKISWQDLYIYDLMQLANNDTYRSHGKTLSDSDQKAIVSLANEQGTYYKPLGELDTQRKTK